MRLVWLIIFSYLLAGSVPAEAKPVPGLVYLDLDGVSRRPLEASAQAGSVLIFYWHDCPICNSYAPELNRLKSGYTNFTFYVVQVDPELTRTAAGEHVRTYDLRVPVILDPQHRLVKATKAKVTPEAVVVGRDGRVRYRGRIDDRYPELGKHRAQATEHDLQDALDAINAGRRVKKKETKPVGCLIE